MTYGWLETAGESIAVHCDAAPMSRLIHHAVRVPLARYPKRASSISLHLQADAAPFPRAGLRIVARDCFSDGTSTVLLNACGSGFDLHIDAADDWCSITARYRPRVPLRAANALLRQRFHLLAGQTLVHYPALWRASWRGRVPLHAAVLSTGAGTAMLVGPSGVGKSTVVAGAVDSGASATSDNLCCADGTQCFGVCEPLRLRAMGASTARRRVATPLRSRVGELAPDRIVILERGPQTRIETAKPDEAARALVAGTYAAGELRRYWQFAATLALATGMGPAHPPVAEVATAYTDRLPCLRVQVGDRARISNAELCGE